MLFSGMEHTSYWAALYFITLMTFGNYVLFNLLVAILVEGFSNQVSPAAAVFFPYRAPLPLFFPLLSDKREIFFQQTARNASQYARGQIPF